jgi:NADPH-dependent curcumin reductase CurA
MREVLSKMSYLAWLHRLRVRREALCYREVFTDGIENAPGAFIGMLDGRNFGKTLVRVARAAWTCLGRQKPRGDLGI